MRLLVLEAPAATATHAGAHATERRRGEAASSSTPATSKATAAPTEASAESPTTEASAHETSGEDASDDRAGQRATHPAQIGHPGHAPSHRLPDLTLGVAQGTPGRLVRPSGVSTRVHGIGGGEHQSLVQVSLGLGKERARTAAYHAAVGGYVVCRRGYLRARRHDGAIEDGCRPRALDVRLTGLL